MSEVKLNKEDFNKNKEKIKELLKKLNADTDKEEIKRTREEFKDVLSRVNPIVIAVAEGELVNEGYSQDDLKNACDVHLELFKDSIENPNLKVPEWHPIYKFQEEHRGILRILERMRELIKEARSKGSFESAEEEIKKIEKFAKQLMDAESHNVRQENTLFPILERHGIEQPPAIMWTEHLEMKEEKKKLLKLLEEKDTYEFEEFLNLIDGTVILLWEQFGAHTQKEENILYATALDVITDEEWQDIKEECDNLGYFNLDID